DGRQERPRARGERREEEAPEPRQPERRELGGREAHESPESTTDAGWLRDARKDVSQPDSEELVLLGRAHGDADRLGCAEAVERADDDALALQPLEKLAARAAGGERGGARAR